MNQGYYPQGPQGYQPVPPQPQGTGFQPGSSLPPSFFDDPRVRSIRDTAGAGTGLSTICLMGFIGLSIIVMYIVMKLGTMYDVIMGNVSDETEDTESKSAA